MMKVIILGKVWEIAERSEDEDPNLKNVFGFCDWTGRTIVIEREIDGGLANMEINERRKMMDGFLGYEVIGTTVEKTTADLFREKLGEISSADVIAWFVEQIATDQIRIEKVDDMTGNEDDE